MNGDKRVRPSVAWEQPVWVAGLTKGHMEFPLRCRNCFAFPLVLVKYIERKFWEYRRCCVFCGVKAKP